MMDLRSLLQDVLSEVSSKVISFQIELHPIISWVKSSGLFQEYRIFEDMHHGITSDSKKTGFWQKNAKRDHCAPKMSNDARGQNLMIDPEL